MTLRWHEGDRRGIRFFVMCKRDTVTPVAVEIWGALEAEGIDNCPYPYFYT